jgi:hypothetical protein
MPMPLTGGTHEILIPDDRTIGRAYQQSLYFSRKLIFLSLFTSYWMWKDMLSLDDRLVCDFEDVDFLDFEIHPTRENRSPVQPGVIIVCDTKVVVALRVCTTVRTHPNATKTWLPRCITLPFTSAEKGD